MGPTSKYLAAVLGRRAASRMANGTRLRIAGTHLPLAKMLIDFHIAVLPPPTLELIAHLAATMLIA